MKKPLALALGIGVAVTGGNALAHNNAPFNFESHNNPNARILGAEGEIGFPVQTVIDGTGREVTIAVFAGRRFTVRASCPRGWGAKVNPLPEGASAQDGALFDEGIDGDGQVAVGGIAPHEPGDELRGTVVCASGSGSDAVEQPLGIRVKAVGLDRADALDTGAEDRARFPYRANGDAGTGSKSNFPFELSASMADRVLLRSGEHNFGLDVGARTSFLGGMNKFFAGLVAKVGFMNDGEQVILPSGSTAEVDSTTLTVSAEAGWNPTLTDEHGMPRVDLGVGAGAGIGHVFPSHAGNRPVPGQTDFVGTVGANVDVGGDDVAVRVGGGVNISPTNAVQTGEIGVGVVCRF